MERAEALAARPTGFAATKRALARAPELPLAEALDYESYLHELALTERADG